MGLCMYFCPAVVQYTCRCVGFCRRTCTARCILRSGILFIQTGSLCPFRVAVSRRLAIPFEGFLIATSQSQTLYVFLSAAVQCTCNVVGFAEKILVEWPVGQS